MQGEQRVHDEIINRQSLSFRREFNDVRVNKWLLPRVIGHGFNESIGIPRRHAETKQTFTPSISRWVDVVYRDPQMARKPCGNIGVGKGLRSSDGNAPNKLFVSQRECRYRRDVPRVDVRNLGTGSAAVNQIG
jgi:hypothetical protein